MSSDDDADDWGSTTSGSSSDTTPTPKSRDTFVPSSRLSRARSGDDGRPDRDRNDGRLRPAAFRAAIFEFLDRRNPPIPAFMGELSFTRLVAAICDHGSITDWMASRNNDCLLLRLPTGLDSPFFFGAVTKYLATKTGYLASWGGPDYATCMTRVIVLDTESVRRERRREHLLASICYQIIEGASGTGFIREHYLHDLNLAFHSVNDTWRENVLRAVLRGLLTHAAYAEHIVAVGLCGSRSSFIDELEVLRFILDFSTCTDIPLKLLVTLSADLTQDFGARYLLDIELEDSKLKKALLDEYRSWVTVVTEAVPMYRSHEDLIVSTLTEHYQKPSLLMSYLRHLKSRTYATKRQLEADSQLLTQPENFFASILEYVPVMHQGLVASALRVLHCATSRLTTTELAAALAAEFATDAHALEAGVPLDVVDAVPSLLAGLIERHEDTLYIASDWVHTMFERSAERSSLQWVVSGSAPDIHMVILSLRYVSIWTGSQTTSSVEKWPFLGYAVRYWYIHFLQVMEQTRAYDEVRSLVEDWELIKSWSLLFRRLWRREPIEAVSRPSLFLCPNELSAYFHISSPMAVKVTLRSTRSLHLVDNDEVAAALWAVSTLDTDESNNVLRTWTEKFSKPSILPKLLRLYCLAPAETFRLLRADELFIAQNAKTLLIPALKQGVTTVVDHCLPIVAAAEPSSASFSELSILSCAAYGHTDLLKRLFDRFPSAIHERDKHGRDALHHAIRSGHLDVVVLLLQFHIDLNLKDVNGFSPALLACGFGFFNILRRLLLEDVDPSASDSSGRNGLHFACDLGFKNIADLLIGQGAPLITKSANDGFTPLHSAIVEDRLHFVKLILASVMKETEIHETVLSSHCSQISEEDGQFSGERESTPCAANVCEVVNGDDENALQCAARRGHVDIVKELLAYTSMATVNVHCLLHYAAEYGNLQLAKYFLDLDATEKDQLDKNQRTPLQRATFYNHLAVVEELMSRGANALTEDYWHDMPIDDAVRHGNEALVRLLMKQRPDEVKLGKLLTTASAHGHTKIVALLLDQGASKDYEGEGGSRPLHEAVSGGHHDIVQLLLLRHVALNLTDVTGTTSLHIAAYRGDLESARMLLDAGATLDVQGDSESSPIEMAASANHCDLVRLLLKRGAVLCAAADQSRTDFLKQLVESQCVETFEFLIKHYETPPNTHAMYQYFHTALRANSPETMSFLLEYGVNPNTISDEEGYGTALQECAYFGNIAMARVLLEHPTHAVKVNETGGLWHTALIASVSRPSKAIDLRYDGKKGKKLLCDGYKKRCSMITYLLKRGADPNIYGGRLGSFLNACVVAAPIDVLQFVLREIQPPINSQDNHGRTPAHMLSLRVLSHSIEKMDLLSTHGANVLPGYTDKMGRKPLHLACGTPNSYILKHLLKRGADVTETDDDGWTPLHWACRRPSTDKIKLLLKYDACITARTIDNWTPWHVAVYHNNKTLGNILGADTFSGEDDRPLPNAGKHFPGYSCDSCFVTLYGKRYNCRTCKRFNLCFKCYKYVDKIHETNHEWADTTEGLREATLISERGRSTDWSPISSHRGDVSDAGSDSE